MAEGKSGEPKPPWYRNPAFYLYAFGACLIFPPILWIASEIFIQTHEDMDIASGKYRHRRYILWIKISERVEDTELSRLYRKLLGPPQPPRWRRVNTFYGESGISPHYRHHGSLHAASALEDAYSVVAFGEEAQKESLLMFLTILQMDDSYFRASDYALAVSEVAYQSRKKGVSKVTLEMLPQPLSEDP